MAIPVGATHYVISTIQSSQVDTTLSDWQTLICVCDMDEGINTNAQSFVAGLEADLSDLEVTDSNDNPIPWRRCDSSTFSQTVGSEKLYIYVNLGTISKITDTEIKLYRGCASPTGENDGSGVVSSDHSIYMPLYEDGATFEDWTSYNNDATKYDMLAPVDGQIGQASHADTSNAGCADIAHNASLDFDQQLTCSMWVKMNDWNHTIIHGTTTGNYRASWWIVGYARYADPHNLTFCYNRYDRFAVEAPIFDSQWHHIAATLNGTDQRLYIDGAFAGDNEATTGNIANENGVRLFQMGARGYYSSLKYGDEVNVLSSAWTENEISTYYTMTSSPSLWSTSSSEQSTAIFIEQNLSYATISFEDWITPNKILNVNQRTLGLFNPSDRTNNDFNVSHRTNNDFNPSDRTNKDFDVSHRTNNDFNVNK